MTALVLLLTFNFQLSTLPAQEPIGPVTRVTTNELQAISNQLPAVSVVTPGVVGAQGGALYYYWVVAKYGRNVVTQDQPAGDAPQSTPALITTAPSPLNGTNYVRICWNTVPNASGYDVLRTYSAILPNGAASIGVALNTAGNCVNDQGGALSSYTLNTYNPAKNPASMKWGRFDMPKITPPPQNAPVGQCRMFVNRTTNSFDAVDEAGASCFPAGGSAAICSNLTQVTNLYVNFNTGNDTTGTGTSGNPWKTIQKAIDSGIPGIVCGRYIINLQVATTYTGAVRLDGRIFAGGGGFTDENTEYPIVNTTPTPDAYSWVEIRGSSTNTSTYIISGMVSTSAANLTLKGVTITGGSVGLHATNRSFVNLAAVKLLDNFAGAVITEKSILHVDNNVYVDDGADSVQITVNGFAGNHGLVIADGSYLTDYLSDGGLSDTGATIHYDKGTGSLSISCIELNASSVYFRGTITCEQSSLVALSSDLQIQFYNFDGLAPNTGVALSLRDSIMTGKVFGGGLYTVTNAATAVSLQGTASISPYPNIVSATNAFVGDGSDSIPANVRSRDTFLSSGHLIDTVTFSATPTFNINTNGSIKKITLTADVTSSTITVQRPGDDITFIICQDGVGGHTFAWPGNVRGEEAIGATLSTCSVQRFVYDQGAAAWLAVAPMVKNQ